MSILRALLLGLALLFAQTVLAEHGIEHAFHDHEDACVECLVLPGFAAVPAQPPRVSMPGISYASASFAVPPAPTFSPHPPFRSRAPPQIQSR